MKSILLVNYEYPPIGAGAGNATRFLAKSMAGLGLERVTVLTAGFGGLRGWAQEDGIEVYRCDSLRRRPDRSNVFEMISFVKGASRAIGPIVERNRPEGVIAFFSIPCGPLGLLARRRHGIPYVVSLRGGDVPGTEKGLSLLQLCIVPLRRSLLKNALAVVANSQGLADASVKADRFPVRVIPNGVDTDYFAPAEEEKSGPVFRVLFVGRFREQKNLFFLLDQFAALAKRLDGKKVELVLVGDGPLRKKLEAHAVRVGIMERTVWKGWLAKDELLRAYRSAHCLVNPSLYEGSPNAVLEAMACGMPVVASSVMGNADIIIDGETGFLIDLAEAAKFSDRLAGLASAPERTAAMGRNSRNLVLRKYSWNRRAEEYISLFSE